MAAKRVPTHVPGIFLSYRRADSDQAASRLTDDLRRYFTPQQVFQDFVSIAPGADFVDAVRLGLDASAAVLVIIGPGWLNAVDGTGRRRLDIPEDWVRHEVAESLRRPGVRVFPVLVGDAVMPGKDDLPEVLQPLTRRQAWPLTVRHWAKDVADLVEHLRHVPGLARPLDGSEPLEPVRPNLDPLSSVPPGVDEQMAPEAATRMPDGPTASVTVSDKETVGERLRHGAQRAGALKWAGVGVGALVLIGVLLTSVPGLRNPPTGKTADDAQVQELGRLADEARSLLKGLDEQRLAVAEAARAAAREVATIAAQASGARSAQERAGLQRALFEAQERSAIAAEVAALHAKKLAGPDGPVAFVEKLGVADAVVKTGDLGQASTQYKDIIVALNTLKGFPQAARGQAEDKREKWLQRLDGKWALQDCASAATFSVKGRVLHVVWPQFGDFEERVLKVAADEVVSVVVNTGTYEGRLSRYVPGATGLTVVDLANNRTATLKRCP